ncbi:2-amino-4-hydroxy-6-hydroxymethyldihydropteridine diphosphokinase [Helicobacter sp. 23-1048]
MAQITTLAQKSYPAHYSYYDLHPALTFQKHRKLRARNHIVLGIGGNMPTTHKVFENLFRTLKNHPKITALHSSPIIKNPAFGYINQPDFLNAVIYAQTSLCLLEIYALVFYLERRFGRKRKRVFKNAPRILDIDIILFNKLILKREYLTIPHIHWEKRLSVCIPLSLLESKH